jgi:hypothetical protein
MILPAVGSRQVLTWASDCIGSKGRAETGLAWGQDQSNRVSHQLLNTDHTAKECASGRTTTITSVTRKVMIKLLIADATNAAADWSYALRRLHSNSGVENCAKACMRDLDRP